MEEIVRYPNCFVCGENNSHGLKARFFWDGNKAVTEVTATTAFEGYRGIFHGGVIGSLLDEVMIKAILAQGKYVVTAEMTIRFHEPARVGDNLIFVGKVKKQRGRIWVTEGEARTADGRVLATGVGKYIEAKEELRAELTRSLKE
jgi:uncharacterized protein (TIGR00369 family)